MILRSRTRCAPRSRLAMEVAAARPSPPSQPSYFRLRTIPPRRSRRSRRSRPHLHSARRQRYLHRLLPRHRQSTCRPTLRVRRSGRCLQVPSRPFHPRRLPFGLPVFLRRSSRIRTCRTPSGERAALRMRAPERPPPSVDFSRLNARSSAFRIVSAVPRVLTNRRNALSTGRKRRNDEYVPFTAFNRRARFSREQLPSRATYPRGGARFSRRRSSSRTRSCRRASRRRIPAKPRTGRSCRRSPRTRAP